MIFRPEDDDPIDRAELVITAWIAEHTGLTRAQVARVLDMELIGARPANTQLTANLSVSWVPAPPRLRVL